MVLSKIFVNNQDTGFEGIPLQQMGESTEMPMSQKAVTDVFNDIFEDFYVFSPRNASSSFKGGYSPTGEPIETQLETKIFTVVENEVIKIEATKGFSSPDFSIISVWSDDTFIESLVNSPKQLPININNYVVPIGANKIAITYVANEIKVLGNRLITDNEPTENSEHLLTSGTLYNVTKFRGTIQNADDVNSYDLLQGLWFTNGYNSNLPTTANGLLVNQGIERIKYQLWFDLVSNSAYYRTCNGVNNTWADWKRFDFVLYKGSLTSENNIDTMYSEALYYGNVSGSKPSGTLPDDVNSSYLLEIAGTGGQICVQRLFVVDNSQVYIRTKINGGAWRPWRRLVVSTELDNINNRLIKSDGILYSLIDEVCNKTILPVASQITGGFSPTGESITSTTKTYFYTVSEGDLLNIDQIAFSSPGFSVVSVWNDNTFVESLINSPTTVNDGYLFYSVPSGVNKIAVSYGENKISKISAKTEEIEEQIAEVEEEVHQPTRNIWPLATDISYDNYLIFGEVGGPTIIPPGTYCFSYELVASGSYVKLILYYDSGNVTVLYNVGSSNGRKTVTFTVEQNVTRVFFTFYQAVEGRTAAFTNIQMEILDWKGYTSSPQKGNWAPLRYATPFIPQKTAVDKIAREYISYWTGKTINYNGDSVTQGGGTGYARVVNQILKFGKVNNYAIGGTRLARAEHGSEIENLNCMVDRIEEMDTVCDIVFILANTNDYASQIPIGNNDDNVKTTYKGALNIIFAWLKNTYRTQPIIISTMLTRKENFAESTAVGNDKYLWFVFKNTEPSESEIASATQASAEISLNTGKYSYISLNNALNSTNPTELEYLTNLPIDGSVNYKYDVNGNTVVWTFNKRNVVLIEEYAQAIRDMVAKYRFILYDAYNLSGLDLLNSPKDGSGITNDGLHPNDAGALSLGRKIAAFINNQ